MSGVPVAPGEEILSAVPDHLFGGSLTDQYLRSTGTSQAAPYVAGASAPLRQAFEWSGVTDIDQDLLYTRFRETADIVFDQVTGGYFHRINLQQAIESVLQHANLAGDVYREGPVQLEDDVLIISGSSGDDHIQIHSGAMLDISVNGDQFQLDRAGISEIMIVGGGGRDSITATITDTIDRAVMQVGASTCGVPN